MSKLPEIMHWSALVLLNGFTKYSSRKSHSAYLHHTDWIHRNVMTRCLCHLPSRTGWLIDIPVQTRRSFPLGTCKSFLKVTNYFYFDRLYTKYIYQCRCEAIAFRKRYRRPPFPTGTETTVGVILSDSLCKETEHCGFSAPDTVSVAVYYFPLELT